MNETFEGRRAQIIPRNTLEGSVNKNANLLLGIRNWGLRADRREDWRRKPGKALS